MLAAFEGNLAGRSAVAYWSQLDVPLAHQRGYAWSIYGIAALALSLWVGGVSLFLWAILR